MANTRILMKYITYVTILVLLVTGCATYPSAPGDCEALYDTQAEVLHCQAIVLKREDRKVANALKEIENKRKARLCWSQGKYYDMADGWCKSMLR